MSILNELMTQIPVQILSMAILLVNIIQWVTMIVIYHKNKKGKG